VEDISFTLRMPVAKCEAHIKALVEVKLFDVTETGLEPHNWNARQYESDVSTNRVRAFRERRMKRFTDVSETANETPPDTEAEAEAETDTEADTEQSSSVAFKGAVIRVEEKSMKQLQGLCPLMSRADILRDLKACDEYYADEPPKKPWWAARKWLERTHAKLLQEKKAKRTGEDAAYRGLINYRGAN
jgi:hypothetical protein